MLLHSMYSRSQMRSMTLSCHEVSTLIIWMA
jgi:hypothetical protein